MFPLTPVIHFSTLFADLRSSTVSAARCGVNHVCVEAAAVGSMSTTQAGHFEVCETTLEQSPMSCPGIIEQTPSQESKQQLKGNSKQRIIILKLYERPISADADEHSEGLYNYVATRPT